LSNKKKNNNQDNNYENNRSSLTSQKEESNDDGDEDIDKPLAKLLIVDDDPDIAQVLKMGLIRKGFLVNSFTNPEEALQSFKSNANDFCLVVSDIRMPGLSGIQLARKVKEVNPDVKVVLMTAFEIRDNEFSTVFPSTHVDGFVQKPIGIGDLTNKILSIIGETKRRRKDEDFEGK
jgi:DNA-binding NtrC family response regulator